MVVEMLFTVSTDCCSVIPGGGQKSTVDRKPDGTPSADRADAVMIAYQPSNRAGSGGEAGREP